MPHRSRPLVALRPFMMTLDHAPRRLPVRCARTSELAQAAHDGELSREREAVLRAHVASCARCRRLVRLEARFLDVLRARLRALPVPAAPAVLRARLRLRGAPRAGSGVRA